MDIAQLTGRADVHMHTCASDGLPNAKQVLDYVARRGHLDVIAITDHDVLKASLWAYNHCGEYPFDIIPGVEVTAHARHVLGLWVTQPIPTKLSIAEMVCAILAHPGEMLISPLNVLRYLQNPAVLLQLGLDGVEVFNAGTMTPGNNVLARRITRSLPLPLVGNSDAHTLSAIGRGLTRFCGTTADDFRAALRAGQVAVEGVRWSLTDYLRLSLSSIPIRRTAYSEMNSPVTPSVSLVD
ncbi:MAG: PHP domain-containing protein [Anaerolineae bacterium]